jgi:hypothetical protein
LLYFAIYILKTMTRLLSIYTEMNSILWSQATLFLESDLQRDQIISKKLLVYTKQANIEEEAITISIDQLSWKYDEHNYRIPYRDGVIVPVIQLQDTNNIYDLLSSASVFPDEAVICGEQFMVQCDAFIGSQRSIDANPNNRYLQKHILDLECKEDREKILSNDSVQSIFVKTDDLLHFYDLVSQDSRLLRKTIVSHNSDHEVNNVYAPFLGKAKRHFGQNCTLQGSGFEPIPIGIENTQWVDHALLHSVRRRRDIAKDKWVYFMFSLSTHPSRRDCYEKLKDFLPWNQPLDKQEYFLELKRHKYAICPRGNALDTHRLWECFYLDVIPIMLRRDSVGINHLPILFVDEWEDLVQCPWQDTFDYLEYKKITLDYYVERIRNPN